MVPASFVTPRERQGDPRDRVPGSLLPTIEPTRTHT